MLEDRFPSVEVDGYKVAVEGWNGREVLAYSHRAERGVRVATALSLTGLYTKVTVEDCILGDVIWISEKE